MKLHKLGGEKYPKFDELNRGQKSALTKLYQKLEKPYQNPAAFVVRKTKYAALAEEAGFVRVGDRVIVHCAINEKVRIAGVYEKDKKGRKKLEGAKISIIRPFGHTRSVINGNRLFITEKYPQLGPGDYIRIHSEWGSTSLTNQKELDAWLAKYEDMVQKGIASGELHTRVEIVTGRVQRMYNIDERKSLSQAIESWNESGKMRR